MFLRVAFEPNRYINTEHVLGLYADGNQIFATVKLSDFAKKVCVYSGYSPDDAAQKLKVLIKAINGDASMMSIVDKILG